MYFWKFYMPDGFSKYGVNWFRLELSNLSFVVNLENNFFNLFLFPAVYPRHSIFGPLLFLIYVKDMPQTLECDLFSMLMIYALSFNIKLSVKFKNSWIRIFLINVIGLCIMSYIYTLVRIRQYQYFLLLNLTGKILKKLNMKHSNIKIKQDFKVKYLGRY